MNMFYAMLEAAAIAKYGQKPAHICNQCIMFESGVVIWLNNKILN